MSRLNAVDGFLDFGIVVLHAHRDAVETDFAGGHSARA